MAWRRIHLVAGATLPLLLVTRAEAAAFEAALGPLIEQAHRLATAMLHDSAAAQDVVQEASIKAWRKLDHLRPGSELRPWYMAIVANECRTTLRSRWRRSMVPLRGELQGDGGPEDAAVAAQDTLRAMRTLRHKDRLVLALHFYLDMSVDDIADVVGISAPAAKARLYRAIHLLRTRLGDAEAPS